MADSSYLFWTLNLLFWFYLFFRLVDTWPGRVALNDTRHLGDRFSIFCLVITLYDTGNLNALHAVLFNRVVFSLLGLDDWEIWRIYGVDGDTIRKISLLFWFKLVCINHSSRCRIYNHSPSIAFLAILQLHQILTWIHWLHKTYLSYLMRSYLRI